MILLIHLYNEREFISESAGEALGIAYIAAYLISNGYSVDVIDEGIERMCEDDICTRILAEDYKLVGFSLSMSNFSKVKRIVYKIRKMGFKGHITYGGHFATLSFKEIFAEDRYVDTIMLSEGEISMYNLIKCIERKDNVDMLDGIVYRDNNGDIKVNPVITRIKDIDILPFPIRTDLKLETRRIASSRGCYGMCSYCSMKPFYDVEGQKVWIPRSVENVLSEIDLLIEKYSVNHIIFVDDNFIGPGLKGKKRAKEMADALINRGYDIGFDIECRANDVDRDLFIKLKEAGLKKVFIGIESGNEEDLILYNKHVSLEQNIYACKILFEIGISSSVGFIMLNPYSTVDKIKKNINMLKEISVYNALSPNSTISRLSIMSRYEIFDKVIKDKKVYYNRDVYQYEYLINDEVELYYAMMLNNFPTILKQLYMEIRIIKNKTRKHNINLFNKIIEIEKECFLLELELAGNILDSIELKDINNILSYKIKIEEKLYKIYWRFNLIKICKLEVTTTLPDKKHSKKLICKKL